MHPMDDDSYRICLQSHNIFQRKCNKAPLDPGLFLSQQTSLGNRILVSTWVGGREREKKEADKEQ